MKENIQLSFIMPCFNSEAFVRNGIENIKRACSIADFSSFEIIAVNDGSTDDTANILDELSENSEEYHLDVIHQQNKGVSSARNAGIRQAKGDWIWFVDADDSITDDSISHISEILTSICEGGNLRTDCIIFGFDILDNEQQATCLPISPDRDKNVDVTTVKKEFLEDSYIKNIAGYSQKNLDRLYNGLSISDQPIFLLGTVWHYLFRKDIIDENILYFDEEVSLNEDGLFVIEYLTCIDKATIINRSFYNYRLNTTGGLFGTLSNPRKMTVNKMAIAQGREKIREKIKQRSNKDIRAYYVGSIVLSMMEIAVKSTSKKFDTELLNLYLKYCHSDVAKYAIKEVSIKGAPIKYLIPFLMLKLRLYRTVFAILWLIQKCGYQITGTKSIFK